MKQKHKYKVGTKVLMGPKIWQRERLDSAGLPHYNPIKPGEVVTIRTQVTAHTYDVVGEGCVGHCHESQILGLAAFKYGEEIEVPCTRKWEGWEKRTFYGYVPTQQGVRICVEGDMDNMYERDEARPLPVKDEYSVLAAQQSDIDKARSLPSRVLMKELEYRLEKLAASEVAV